jgi:hypothetical protein
MARTLSSTELLVTYLWIVHSSAFILVSLCLVYPACSNQHLRPLKMTIKEMLKAQLLAAQRLRASQTLVPRPCILPIHEVPIQDHLRVFLQLRPRLAPIVIPSQTSPFSINLSLTTLAYKNVRLSNECSILPTSIIRKV